MSIFVQVLLCRKVNLLLNYFQFPIYLIVKMLNPMAGWLSKKKKKKKKKKKDPIPVWSNISFPPFQVSTHYSSRVISSITKHLIVYLMLRYWTISNFILNFLLYGGKEWRSIFMVERSEFAVKLFSISQLFHCYIQSQISLLKDFKVFPW